MKGPSVYDLSKVPSGLIALQSASDAAETSARVSGYFQDMRLAEKESERRDRDEVRREREHFQDLRHRESEEGRRGAEEGRRAQVFDEEMAELERERGMAEADREVDVQGYQEQARQRLTRGMMERSLRSGFPTPPDPALMQRMRARIETVRRASPEGRAEAQAWLARENERDAFVSSQRSMAVQVEDMQRIGAFGEDESTLAAVDEIREAIKEADSIDDLREARGLLDSVRAEVGRQRKLLADFTRGDAFLQTEMPQDPADPRLEEFHTIASAWRAGGFQGMDDLKDAVIKAKYGVETSRSDEKVRFKAVEMAMAAREAGGLGGSPTWDEVEGLVRMLKGDSPQKQLLEQVQRQRSAPGKATGNNTLAPILNGRGGGEAQPEEVAPTSAPAQAAAPAAEPAAAAPSEPAAPTRAYAEARGEMIEALRSGDVEALRRLEGEVGELTDAQLAELEQAIKKQNSDEKKKRVQRQRGVQNPRL